jgi:type II secretory pathway pseudopilin PulG
MTKNKKILIIVLAIVAIILAVTAVIVVLATNSSDDKNEETTTATVVTSTTDVETTTEEQTDYVALTTGDEETTVADEEETTEEEETTQERTTVSYTLPVSGDTVSASFTPYKCITESGEVISSDFNSQLGGSTSISLNSDGSYSFALGSVINSSGTYTLDGNSIELSDGYSGTVSYDSNNNPIAVIISAEGYQVYFN